MSEKYNPGFWDQACSTPPPARRLYLVRMLFLVVPALTLVYFFEAIGLDPIGAVPLMYLSLHGWFAQRLGGIRHHRIFRLYFGVYSRAKNPVETPGRLVPHSDHLDYGVLRDRDFMLPHIRLPDLPQVPLPCRT